MTVAGNIRTRAKLVVWMMRGRRVFLVMKHVLTALDTTSVLSLCFQEIDGLVVDARSERKQFYMYY